MAESSFEIRRSGSRNAGEGERTGLGASERDRGLGEPLAEVLEDLGVRSPSLCSICCVRLDLLGERPRPTAGAYTEDIMEVDMAARDRGITAGQEG